MNSRPRIVAVVTDDFNLLTERQRASRPRVGHEMPVGLDSCLTTNGVVECYCIQRLLDRPGRIAREVACDTDERFEERHSLMLWPLSLAELASSMLMTIHSDFLLQSFIDTQPGNTESDCD